MEYEINFAKINTSAYDGLSGFNKFIESKYFCKQKKKKILKTGIKTEKKKKFKYFMSFLFLF